MLGIYMDRNNIAPLGTPLDGVNFPSSTRRDVSDRQSVGGCLVWCTERLFWLNEQNVVQEGVPLLTIVDQFQLK